MVEKGDTVSAEKKATVESRCSYTVNTSSALFQGAVSKTQTENLQISQFPLFFFSVLTS